MKRLLCVVFIYIFGTLNSVQLQILENGEPCVNSNFDGQPGICQPNNECQWAINKLKKKEIKLTQLTRCGSFAGKQPIICCPQSAAATPSVRKSVAMCKDYQSRKYAVPSFNVLNGRPADPGEFPHMAAIGYRNENNPVDYLCGGSLISNKFVLTASHCVNRRDTTPVTVKLGRVSLINEYDEDSNPSVDVDIERIIIHPKYTSRRKYNDIALIELKRAVEFTIVLRPACLHTKDDDKDKGALQISGWGRLDSSNETARSNWLMKADTVEIDLNECRSRYQTFQINSLPEGVIDDQICAINKLDGKVIDACQGDSGGPLQWFKTINHDKHYYIYGVVSFGIGCGADFPGAYTRVSSFLDWIEPIVWP